VRRFNERTQPRDAWSAGWEARAAEVSWRHVWSAGSRRRRPRATACTGRLFAGARLTRRDEMVGREVRLGGLIWKKDKDFFVKR
jgi:hypothetical protein